MNLDGSLMKDCQHMEGQRQCQKSATEICYSCKQVVCCNHYSDWDKCCKSCVEMIKLLQ